MQKVHGEGPPNNLCLRVRQRNGHLTYIIRYLTGVSRAKHFSAKPLISGQPGPSQNGISSSISPPAGAGVDDWSPP